MVRWRGWLKIDGMAAKALTVAVGAFFIGSVDQRTALCVWVASSGSVTTTDMDGGVLLVGVVGKSSAKASSRICLCCTMMASSSATSGLSAY